MFSILIQCDSTNKSAYAHLCANDKSECAHLCANVYILSPGRWAEARAVQPARQQQAAEWGDRQPTASHSRGSQIEQEHVLSCQPTAVWSADVLVLSCLPTAVWSADCLVLSRLLWTPAAVPMSIVSFPNSWLVSGLSADLASEVQIVFSSLQIWSRVPMFFSLSANVLYILLVHVTRKFVPELTQICFQYLILDTFIQCEKMTDFCWTNLELLLFWQKQKF